MFDKDHQPRYFNRISAEKLYSKRYIALIIEWTFVLLLLVALAHALWYLFAEGYLPEPFFEDSNDTFVDWYSTAYWAHNAGAYSAYLSVYPPLSFVFLNLFSSPWCYSEFGRYARTCDPLGGWVLAAFMALNFYISLCIFRKSDRETAIPRAIAMTIGSLYAWERGNLIVVALTFFMLGHGRLLKSAWLKWICAAAAINFKPYLIVALFGKFARRRFRWLEGVTITIVVLYAVSYALLGSGTPFEVYRNIVGFAHPEVQITLEAMEYTTTYSVIMNALNSQLPITYYTGSLFLDIVQFILPILMKIGELGVILCIIGAMIQPKAVPTYRLAALPLALVLTLTNPGSYTFSFLLFLLFLEKERRLTIFICMIAGYMLCSPYDKALIPITHITVDSYLGGRTVTHAVNYTFGAVLRPGLILIVEYNLVAASLIDLFQYRARRKISESLHGAKSVIQA